MGQEKVRMLRETGQVSDQLPVWIPPKKHAPYDFIWLVHDAMMHLCKSGLTGNELSVLFFALAKLSKDDEIFFDTPLCVVETGIGRTNVQAALKVLVSRGLLIKTWRFGNKWVMRPNKTLCWRGELEKWCALAVNKTIDPDMTKPDRCYINLEGSSDFDTTG